MLRSTLTIAPADGTVVPVTKTDHKVTVFAGPPPTVTVTYPDTLVTPAEQPFVKLLKDDGTTAGYLVSGKFYGTIGAAAAALVAESIAGGTPQSTGTATAILNAAPVCGTQIPGAPPPP
jgi:hypothetical protein